MFEAVELGQEVSKEEFKEQVQELRTQLIQAQITSKEYPGPIIILISGMDGAGKGELVNFLGDILDMRDVVINTFWDETDDEKNRPYYWRFWRSLPARGQIGIFFGAWYTNPIQNRVNNEIDDLTLEHELRRIVRMENMLTDDNAVILKFWLHLSKKAQKDKHNALEKKFKDAKETMDRAMWNFNHYDKIKDAAEQVIRYTDRAHARWQLIEATDKRHSQLKVLKSILQTIEYANSNTVKDQKQSMPSLTQSAPLIDSIDLSKTIEPDTYKKELKQYQAKINQLAWKAYKQNISSVIIFEGVDAAGKGGCIKRLTQSVDTRLQQVISVAAPTDEEKNHHYLWRFWRHLPRAGFVTTYDRSWYGRVLVERVEGFASESAWNRSYEEINEFEEQLTESGILLLKFWIHIDQDEQLRRFKEREVIPWKQHKITDEDWRNREKWPEYKDAINEMITRTSTRQSAWHLISGNDKKSARIEVLKKYHELMEKRLDEK